MALIRPDRDACNKVIAIGEATKANFPRAFARCHVEGDPENRDFIILFARACTRSLNLSNVWRIGLNGKRGNEHDPSLDVLAFLDVHEPNPRVVAAADVVLGAGGPNASIICQDITDPNGAGAIYLDPFKWSTVVAYDETSGGSGGGGSEPVRIPGYEEVGGDAIACVLGRAIVGSYAEAGQPINSGAAVWFFRPLYDFMRSLFSGGKGWTMKQAAQAHIDSLRVNHLGLAPKNLDDFANVE